MIKNRIIKESFKVLILGSIISSVGGLGLEVVKQKLLVFLPLLIVLPALTNMIGHAGIIFVSKVTTYFHMRRIKYNKLNNRITRHLLFNLMIIFSLASIYITFLSIFVSYLKGYPFELYFELKMFGAVFLTTLVIVLIVFCVALYGARYAHQRNIDPDDLLIPITTSVADLGSLIVFSLLVFFMF
ncbi:magnesium transporter [Candidatus Woesearchaeota archaeon]|nr:magnesium transporter [Candidatus Woesearchaeota archaeon]